MFNYLDVVANHFFFFITSLNDGNFWFPPQSASSADVWHGNVFSVNLKRWRHLLSSIQRRRMKLNERKRHIFPFFCQTLIGYTQTQGRAYLLLHIFAGGQRSYLEISSLLIVGVFSNQLHSTYLDKFFLTCPYRLGVLFFLKIQFNLYGKKKL